MPRGSLGLLRWRLSVFERINVYRAKDDFDDEPQESTVGRLTSLAGTSLASAEHGPRSWSVIPGLYLRVYPCPNISLVLLVLLNKIKNSSDSKSRPVLLSP
jgi:hypothetical protein